MGCPVGRAFLASTVDSTVDAAWRSKYMAGLIAIGPPWAGAPDALQSIIDGPVYSGLTPDWATGFIGEFVGRATSTWAGLMSLLPVQIGLTVYNDSEPLVTTPNKSFTVKDMKALLKDVAKVQENYTAYSINRTDLWDYMSSNFFTLSDGPGVDLDCIYLVDRDTPFALKFAKDDFSDVGEYISFVKGDGTVPMISAATPPGGVEGRGRAPGERPPPQPSGRSIAHDDASERSRDRDREGRAHECVSRARTRECLIRVADAWRDCTLGSGFAPACARHVRGVAVSNIVRPDESQRLRYRINACISHLIP